MISDHFTQSFSVYSVTQTPDDGGALADSLNLQSTANGYFEPLSGTERIIHGKPEAVATHRLYCPLSVVIVESDQVLHEGNYYSVVFVNPMVKGNNAHKEVDLQIQDGNTR